MDRRALFFLGAAALSAVMIPIAEKDWRWVAVATAVTYVVLAVLAALDSWSRSRSRGPR
jgi:hypothetical protein